MKKIFLAGMLLLAANAFCQEALNKDQEKKLKTLQKQTTTQLNSIVANTQMSLEEKKNRVQSIKNERDFKLKEFMDSSQVTAVLEKDQVKWDDAMKKIDKNEKTRLDKEKKLRLNEISDQQKNLDRQQSDLDKQIKDLKAKQDDLKKQQKALKDKEKTVKNEYK